MNKNNGFTLIELLVVLVITAILFSVGVASFRDFSRRKALDIAKEKVITDLKLTQQLALSGEKPASCNYVTGGTLYGFKFELNTDVSGYDGTYKIVAVCETPNPSPPPTSTLDYQTVGRDKTFITDNEDITVGLSSGYTNDSVVFRSLTDGVDSSWGIVLTNTDTGKTETITVNASGIIQ